MRKMMKSAAATRRVKKEFIAMDLDDEDEDVICGEVKEECMMDTEESNTTTTECDETNPPQMQQTVSDVTSDDDGDDWDTKIDHHYMMLLDSFREDGNSYLSDNPLRCIRYEVDNGGYDSRRIKAVVNKRSRENRSTIRVTKKNVGSKPHVQETTKKRTMKEAGFKPRRRESLATEKSVEAMLSTSHVKRNSQHNGNTSEKENLEDHMVDERYKSYLKWLVENSTSSRTNPGKEIQVKCEEDYTMSLSDSDSDIIFVEDRLFLDEEDSPFVPSKSYKVIDLDDESSDERSSWFRKEIMNVLKQPYTETEHTELHKQASVRSMSTRHIELRDGKNFSFNTKKERPSYLDGYPDFKKKYLDTLREHDEHKALNLLRGFIFYLTNLVRDDAFKPWLDHECLKIRCF